MGEENAYLEEKGKIRMRRVCWSETKTSTEGLTTTGFHISRRSQPSDSQYRQRKPREYYTQGIDEGSGVDCSIERRMIV